MKKFLPLAVLFAASCGDSTSPARQPAVGRALVLNSTGARGVTILADTGSATTRIAFEEPFDGAAFTVRGDSVLSASSKSGGDLLFVAVVRTSTVISFPDTRSGTATSFQLPARSNPSGAIFLPAGAPGANGARFAVALRDSNAVGLVNPGAAAAQRVALVRNAGHCPYDLVYARSALYIADANQNCRTDYSVVGPVRLIRAPLDSVRRDTISLGDGVVGAPRVHLIGDIAYVATSGDYFSTSASLVRVDLRTRMVTHRYRFPADTYASTFRIGADGVLYVTATTGFDPYAPRVYAFEASTLAPRASGRTGQIFLDLRLPGGELATCDAATADAEGDIYCLTSGLVSRVRVFDRSTRALRRDVPAGSFGADIVVR